MPGNLGSKILVFEGNKCWAIGRRSKALNLFGFSQVVIESLWCLWLSVIILV